MSTPNYYAILTADVRYDQNLKDSEKLLYAEITALTGRGGYCYASNSYFARLYNKTPETISRMISNLIKLGYLQSKFQYKEHTKEIQYRLLYPCHNSQGVLMKISTGVDENIITPLDENVKDIKLIKNKLNYKTKNKKNNASNDALSCIEYFNKVNATNHAGAKEVLSGLNKILDEYTVDDVKLVIDYMHHGSTYDFQRKNGFNLLSTLAKPTKFYSKLEPARQMHKYHNPKTSPHDLSSQPSTIEEIEKAVGHKVNTREEPF